MSEGKILQLNGKHQEAVNNLDVLAAIKAKLASSNDLPSTVMGLLQSCAQMNFEKGYEFGLAKGIYKGYTKCMDDWKSGDVSVPLDPEKG